MSKGLFDYAENNPVADAALPDPEKKIRNVIEDEQRAAELMQEIGDKLRQAAPPSNVLEDALSLIGILTRNEEWAEAMRKRAAEQYGEEKLDGLFLMPEADRLREKRRALQEKTVRSLSRSANACAALEKELRAAIEAAHRLTTEAEIWEDDGKETDETDIPL